MKRQSCVSPEGKFCFGVHAPRYRVRNLRQESCISTLGTLQDDGAVGNSDNFPDNDITVRQADRVYEIPNAFPFKGTTYISEHFADATARDPSRIALEERKPVSLSATIEKWAGKAQVSTDHMVDLYRTLPEPLVLALATTSTDAEELTHLARLSCRFVDDERTGRPSGVVFEKGENGQIHSIINNYPLYKALANNPFLPDAFKDVMVLRPGIQGGSRITAEWRSTDRKSHVFEYLRRNSYIPWGHYAANMANDAVRYHVRDLTPADMTGMRHLYYQRTYVRMAESMGIAVTNDRKGLTETELETVRMKIRDALPRHSSDRDLEFNSTLWGWNYGFDYTPTGYRMHGSHQQIHQQYALVPPAVDLKDPDNPAGAPLSAFACGDLIAAFIRDYREQTGKPFFDSYIRAIRENRRMDGYAEGEISLVVYEKDGVLLFVPKSQTSQWELQLMTTAPAGNIIETDSPTRRALDRAMLIAVKLLAAMGARLITGIEYSKRFDTPDPDQRLLYCFLPRLPQSPGAFSEAQLRWINRHFPEDFAAACRSRLPAVLGDLEG